MTWIAHLDGGPLDGGTVTLHGQFWAVALPIGEIAQGLAVYELVRTPERWLPNMPAGRLRYEFEGVREHTLAEARLFARAAVEREAAVA